MKYTYICHHCISYQTNDLSDMIKHYKRKTHCKCNYIFSYDESNYLSRRKYVFNIDTSNFVNNDYIFIITHYTNNINIINDDYKSAYLQKEKEEEKEEKENSIYTSYDSNHSLQIEDNNSCIKLSEYSNGNILDFLKNVVSSSMTSSYLKPLVYKNFLQESSEIKEELEEVFEIPDIITLDFVEKNKNNHLLIDKIIKKYNSEIIQIDINSELSKIKYNLILYDLKKDKFICDKCNSDYTHINSIKRHFKKNTCIKRKKVIDILNNCNAINEHIIKNEELKKDIYNTYVNNTQNIQNNNNNNNNMNNNTYNLSIKDFIHDNYDLSHITNNFYAQKDCFLYHNFLRVIMENKKNQNIYFLDKEAIIYTDRGLNKMSSDKAGYLILDKLSQSFSQLLYRQDDETQNFYSFIQKYYYVIKGHYKHDTIFKDYDVDLRQFVYTANSSSFRSRDRYLSKMITTLQPIQDSTRTNMNIHIDNLHTIYTLNPNIEDFASVKMRYRDLKDKD